MRKRRLSALVGLAVAAATLFTACSGGAEPSDSGDSVTLTIMGRKSDLEKTYMTRVFDLYEQATGNKVELIRCGDTEFEPAAAQDFADGKGPDLLMHFHNAELSGFDLENDFYLLNDEPWVEDLTDSALAYCQDDQGDLLGLPFWENSVSGCYYNKTLLDSLGLLPATNQSEFDTLCQALAETGYTPICWPANGCSWMIQFGLDPIFADDPDLLAQLNAQQIAYADIPQVTDMVRWVDNAADSGWFGNDYLQTGWDEISSAMASGKAVMTFIWDTWFYTDLEQGGKYGVDDFALMPVFMNTAENGTYEGGNLNMMMVNKNSEHLETALEFLRFCAQPEHYNAAFDGISTVSCFKGQTTNIQSQMVTDAKQSLAANERVSTAASRIVGYSTNDVLSAFNAMLSGRTDVNGCVQMLDDYRLAGIQAQDTGPTPRE